MPKKQVIFLHIPKTAGSSLNSIIRRQYKSSEFFHVNSINNEKEMISKLIEIKDSKKIIFGHHSFGLHKYLDINTKYITLLRNPIDRIISIYYYIGGVKKR